MEWLSADGWSGGIPAKVEKSWIEFKFKLEWRAAGGMMDWLPFAGSGRVD